VKRIVIVACGAAVAAATLLTAPVGPTAHAEPARSCDPYSPTGPACPSRPTGNCNPYSSNGNGFLGCLGGNWEDESVSSSSGSTPTITNPGDVYAVTRSDVYTLICNDLDVHGVSVPSVEDIYHVLYVAPYGYAKPDAGRAVALAVNTTCPRHRAAMDAATRQALGS
jgi:hypothetical protein